MRSTILRIILVLILTLPLLSVSVSRSVFWDEVVYHELSRNASYTIPTPIGEQDEAFRPPGYPFLLRALGVQSIPFQRGVNSLSILLFLALLASILPFSTMLGLLAALPFHAFLGLTEAVQLILTFTILLILTRAPARKEWIILTGMLILLASLVKYSLILLSIPWIVWLVRTRPRKAELIPSLTTLALILMLILSAWQAWLPTGMSIPTALRVQAEQLAQNPTHPTLALYLPLLPLIILSLPILTRLNEKRIMILLSFALAFSLAFLLSPEKQYRYLTPLIASLTLIAWEALRKKSWLTHTLSLLSSVLAILMLIMNVQSVLSTYPSWHAAREDATQVSLILTNASAHRACSIDALPLTYYTGMRIEGKCILINTSWQGVLVMPHWQTPWEGLTRIGETRYYTVYEKTGS